MRPALLLTAAALTLSLGACGRVGPVRAPGPPEKIISPRAYPFFPPGSPEATPNYIAPANPPAGSPLPPLGETSVLPPNR